MARAKLAFLAFNRGLVSPLGLARADVKRIALSAEEMTNYTPRVLGSMMLRAGMEYITPTYYSGAADGEARCLSFIFSTSDTARIELNNTALRVLVDGTDPIRRSQVATTIADISTWTDADEAGATSAMGVSVYGNPVMAFTGTGTNFAIRRQLVTNLSPGIEHGLSIEIIRGPVLLRIGTSAGDDDILSETSLETGVHSIGITPVGDFWVEFKQNLERQVQVASPGCVVEASAGDEDMLLLTPWFPDDLQNIRFDQSGDVLFVACAGHRQKRIERRSSRSWSIVDYLTEDGPFRAENTTTITLTPSVLTGNGTLTASKPVFRSTHVGALFSVSSIGQTVSKNMTALNDATAAIRVNGVSGDRGFTIVLSGLTATGNTVVLQRSFDNATWTAVTGKSWTADTNETFTDGLDNQIVYYRLICTVYAAGTTVASLTIATGSITGICRVTNYTSSTVVDVEVLSAFGSTSASDIWAEGAWSDDRGWPTAVQFDSGRLTWSGKNGFWGSVPDGFNSFDANVTGDSGPLQRTIGSGPVDTINWLLSLKRLLLGAQGAEFVCKSTSFDEPITPTNLNIKQISGQGSSGVEAVKIDDNGVFVQRGGTRVFSLDLDASTLDYVANHLSVLVPEIGLPGIVRIGVQRQPDTRIHCVRTDGTVALCVFDKVENVLCWCELETDGEIEDVTVLPAEDGTQDDRVFYVVMRNINGSPVRYHELVALESECQGGQHNCQLDAFIRYTGGAIDTIPAAHLEGETVHVWADGTYRGSGVVAGGVVTMPSGSPALNIVTGLTYRARWKSGKLQQLVGEGVAGMAELKTVEGLGLVMRNVHPQGVRYGPSFDKLSDLPAVVAGKVIDQNATISEWAEQYFAFGGVWNTDSRICLESNAPKPATLQAIAYKVQL